jgi:hypothetical protein
LENRADGSTLILSEFDEFMAELYENRNQLPHPKHISLGTFREALFLFFKHFDLSAKFVKDAAEWKKFSRLYCRIVGECPIVFTASKTKLKYIHKVELRGISRGIVVKEWPIVEWRLTLQNGSTQIGVFTWDEMVHNFPQSIEAKSQKRETLELLPGFRLRYVRSDTAEQGRTAGVPIWHLVQMPHFGWIKHDRKTDNQRCRDQS